jgi:pyrimidine-nucleoside phosphorylase
MTMNILQIIEQKVNGQALSEAAITFFVHGYAKGDIPDYQVSALLMAIKLKGMNELETAQLTQAMVTSGDTVDLSGIEGITVDKHSTGGVGDKTSLVIGPIVAALGLKLAKMSGRGLGHTGGTIDKLESIPGLTTSLTSTQFKQQVNDIGLAIIGQTQSLVPADKKMYALRDVTGTVQSIPLIASSIMSKKIASGAKTILLDVKFGSGAFMKTVADAKVLAKAMVAIGRKLGRDTRAMITDMDQPLGFAIGNRNEVLEAIETLKGKGPSDLLSLCVQASAMMAVQAKRAPTLEKGITLVEEVIHNGLALKKLYAMIAAQGGQLHALEQTDFITTSSTLDVTPTSSGYIHHIDALMLGEIASMLGAGRLTKDDAIDPNAGIIMRKKVGDFVDQKTILATFMTNRAVDPNWNMQIQQAFHIGPTPKPNPPIIHDWILS